MAKTSTLKEQIYKDLLNRIIIGEYPPDTVFSESFLVEKYHVSKSPIREALIELCHEGVLKSIPRYGYVIVRLTDEDVEKNQQFRLILETGCLDRYWDMITPGEVRELRELVNNSAKRIKEIESLTHWTENQRFHRKLISFFNNEYIYNALESALIIMTRAYMQFNWKKRHKTTYYAVPHVHERLVEALEAGDKAKALEYLAMDICNFDEEEQPFQDAAVLLG